MPRITMSVNGRSVTADVPAETLLVHFLRETLDLTGTHVGCDTSQCGACVVHLNGSSVKSCTCLAVECEGQEVTTIEGLGRNGENGENGQMHPMQEAFRRHHGLQCGFCTPGMVMSAVDLLETNPDPDEGEVREWLAGNFCRCTGYHNIVEAVLAAADGSGGGGSLPRANGGAS